MKKTIFILLLIGTMAFIQSCTANYEKINTNPYEVTKEQMNYDSYNSASALAAMEGFVVPLDVNLHQFIECLLGGSYGGYLADSNNGFNAGKFSTYNPQEAWLKVPFNDIIPKLYSNQEDLKIATSDPVLLSVAMIIKVAAISRITDIYGPIPYSKIGIDNKLSAPFDSQKEVYNSMFTELNNAISSLSAHRTQNFNPNADKVFNGNVIKWIKFGNSLKLRLAMRIVYADESLAREEAESAVNHEIGTITSNDDNAFMTVYKNPFRIVMYEYNGGDSRISADITTYMNGFKDPRRSKFFTQTTFEDKNIINGYYGLRSGIEIPSSGGLVHAYSNMIVSSDTKLMWMNASEIAFLKAEGVIRGWNMGISGVSAENEAEGFYRKGIILSFQQWGAGDANTYTNDNTSKPDIYKDPLNSFSYSNTTSNITIKWDQKDSFETKLEKIITQKWIANFPLGLEAWSEFRRTGYPKLMEVVDNKSGGIIVSTKMARRLPYPQTEYTENATNIHDALKLLNGPDNMATKVWWDCKNK